MVDESRVEPTEVVGGEDEGGEVSVVGDAVDVLLLLAVVVIVVGGAVEEVVVAEVSTVVALVGVVGIGGMVMVNGVAVDEGMVMVVGERLVVLDTASVVDEVIVVSQWDQGLDSGWQGSCFSWPGGVRGRAAISRIHRMTNPPTRLTCWTRRLRPG